METKKTELTTEQNAEDYPFKPAELSAFSQQMGIFVISRKDGEVEGYEPEDPEAFSNWLINNGIRDING